MEAVIAKRNRRRTRALQTGTIRQFDGGLDLIDNPLNLDTNFSIVMDNVYLWKDGSIGVRPGTRLFADLSETSGGFIHSTYYDDYMLLFASNGEIYRIDSAGALELIWSDAIAALLPGAPDGWSDTLTFVSTTIFGGQLIACNGIDKPITIKQGRTPIVEYLQDESTASNANTPIGRYVIGLNDYVIIAGDPLALTTIHISSRGTAGTFVGDPAPNDAVNIDISKWHGVDPPEITGLSEFRDKLFVHFESLSMPVLLGIYDETGAHTPEHDDHIEGHGTLAHHALQKVSNDLFMMDHVGVPSMVRGLFTATAEPKRVSELIDPAIQRNLSRLKLNTIRDRVFAVHHWLESQYMLFIPDQDDRSASLSADPLVALREDDGRIRVYWPNHLLDAGNTVRLEGAAAFNVYTAEDLNDEHTVDAVIDNDYFDVTVPGKQSDLSDPTTIVGGGGAIVATAVGADMNMYVYTYTRTGRKIKAWSRMLGIGADTACVTALGRVLLVRGSLVFALGDRSDPIDEDFVDSEYRRAIDYAWELPWFDIDERANVKASRYIRHDTIGDDQFLCQMFVDEFDKNQYGELTPALEMQFTGSRGGYGASTQPYGGGRKTNDPRLYGWPARFKLARLRYSGQATKPLRFVSITLYYNRGSIRL